MPMVWRLSSLPYGMLIRVLTTWPFASCEVANSDETLTKMETAVCFMTHDLCYTPSLLLYSICYK